MVSSIFGALIIVDRYSQLRGIIIIIIIHSLYRVIQSATIS